MNDETTDRFRRRVLRIMQSRNITYRELSEESGVQLAYLHRLITGKATNPGLDVAARIATGLGVMLYTLVRPERD